MNTTPKQKAFLCRRFTPVIEAELEKRFDLDIHREDTVLTPFDIANRGNGAEVLFVTATEMVNADVIRLLRPGLKTIATLSVGYEHIDMAAARSLAPDPRHRGPGQGRCTCQPSVISFELARCHASVVRDDGFQVWHRR